MRAITVIQFQGGRNRCGACPIGVCYSAACQMAFATNGGRDQWHLGHLAAGTFGMWDKWHLGHMALAQQHVGQMAFTKWHLGQVALVQENNIWIICSML